MANQAEWTTALEPPKTQVKCSFVVLWITLLELTQLKVAGKKPSYLLILLDPKYASASALAIFLESQHTENCASKTWIYSESMITTHANLGPCSNIPALGDFTHTNRVYKTGYA